MPRAWRIVSPRWATTAFNGEGARIYGGRWNSPASPVVYVAGSRALAALEMLVHLNEESAQMEFLRFEVTFPDALVEDAELDELSNALTTPMVGVSTQAYGDEWLKSAKRPILRVPSAIIPEEANYLLNPAHPEFSKVKIAPPERFAFDPRLLER